MIFIRYLWDYPQLFFMQIFVVVVSVCCHELAHAWVALKEGDATAAEQGHLTLNPLKQMGLWSLVLLCLIGLAWGQVPVNPARMRRKVSDMIVSLAGPCTNLLLFLLFSAGMAFCEYFKAPPPAYLLCKLGGVINIVLFVINIMPVPGFDGWHVLTHFAPHLKQARNEMVGGIAIFLVLLVVVFLDYVYAAGVFLTELAAKGVFHILTYF